MTKPPFFFPKSYFRKENKDKTQPGNALLVLGGEEEPFNAIHITSLLPS